MSEQHYAMCIIMLNYEIRYSVTVILRVRSRYNPTHKLW